MSDSTAVEAALEPVRTQLEADGAKLALKEYDGKNLTVELVFTEETCLECIANGEILRLIIMDALQQKGISALELDLVDPRRTQD